MACGWRAARPRARARSARRVRRRRQGPVRGRGIPGRRRRPRLSRRAGTAAGFGGQRDRAAAGRGASGRHRANRRVRLQHRRPKRALRCRAQPGGTRAARRRLLKRPCGRGGPRPGGDRPRHRHCRVDPGARLLPWPCRVPPDSRRGRGRRRAAAGPVVRYRRLADQGRRREPYSRQGPPPARVAGQPGRADHPAAGRRTPRRAGDARAVHRAGRPVGGGRAAAGREPGRPAGGNPGGMVHRVPHGAGLRGVAGPRRLDRRAPGRARRRRPGPVHGSLGRHRKPGGRRPGRRRQGPRLPDGVARRRGARAADRPRPGPAAGRRRRGDRRRARAHAPDELPGTARRRASGQPAADRGRRPRRPRASSAGQARTRRSSPWPPTWTNRKAPTSREGTHDRSQRTAVAPQPLGHPGRRRPHRPAPRRRPPARRAERQPARRCPRPRPHRPRAR